MLLRFGYPRDKQFEISEEMNTSRLFSVVKGKTKLKNYLIYEPKNNNKKHTNTTKQYSGSFTRYSVSRGKSESERERERFFVSLLLCLFFLFPNTLRKTKQQQQQKKKNNNTKGIKMEAGTTINSPLPPKTTTTTTTTTIKRKSKFTLNSSPVRG
eukprot:gene6812-4892_t